MSWVLYTCFLILSLALKIQHKAKNCQASCLQSNLYALFAKRTFPNEPLRCIMLRIKYLFQKLFFFSQRQQREAENVWLGTIAALLPNTQLKHRMKLIGNRFREYTRKYNVTNWGVQNIFLMYLFVSLLDFYPDFSRPFQPPHLPLYLCLGHQSSSFHLPFICILFSLLALYIYRCHLYSSVITIAFSVGKLKLSPIAVTFG